MGEKALVVAEASEPCATPPERKTLHVVIDRLVIQQRDRARLVEALEAAFQRGAGILQVEFEDGTCVDMPRANVESIEQ